MLRSVAVLGLRCGHRGRLGPCGQNLPGASVAALARLTHDVGLGHWRHVIGRHGAGRAMRSWGSAGALTDEPPALLITPWLSCRSPVRSQERRTDAYAHACKCCRCGRNCILSVLKALAPLCCAAVTPVSDNTLYRRGWNQRGPLLRGWGTTYYPKKFRAESLEPSDGVEK